MPLFPRQAVKYLNNDLVSGLNISLPDLLSLPLPSRCVPFFPSSYFLFSFLFSLSLHIPPYSQFPFLSSLSFFLSTCFFNPYSFLFPPLFNSFFLLCLSCFLFSLLRLLLASLLRCFLTFFTHFCFVPFLHPFSFFACFFVFLPSSC